MKEFGNLGVKLRGLVFYKISAYEQKAFKGYFKQGIPRTWMRFKDEVFRVSPAFIATFLLMNYIEAEHKRLSRKNPADFECDV